MRKCPNCKTSCQIGTGVFFDSEGNVYCIHCKGVILGVDFNTDLKIKKRKITAATAINRNEEEYPGHVKKLNGHNTHAPYTRGPH